eukprot:6161577-Prymnesium_polylepis.2
MLTAAVGCPVLRQWFLDQVSRRIRISRPLLMIPRSPAAPGPAESYGSGSGELPHTAYDRKVYHTE